MSEKEVQEALKGEYTEHVNAKVEASDKDRKSIVNLDFPRWSVAAEIPVTRDSLSAAYLQTVKHPYRGLAKKASHDLASHERARATRQQTRLQAYALNKVRRDVLETLMKARLSVLTDLAT